MRWGTSTRRLLLRIQAEPFAALLPSTMRFIDFSDCDQLWPGYPPGGYYPSESLWHWESKEDASLLPIEAASIQCFRVNHLVPPLEPFNVADAVLTSFEIDTFCETKGLLRGTTERHHQAWKVFLLRPALKSCPFLSLLVATGRLSWLPTTQLSTSWISSVLCSELGSYFELFALCFVELTNTWKKHLKTFVFEKDVFVVSFQWMKTLVR